MVRARTFGLIVGCVLLLGALGALGYALAGFAQGEDIRFAALGEIWAAIDTNSLVGFGAIVEKRISPELWFSVMVPLLSQPAWLVLGVPGAVLAALCFPWRRLRAAAPEPTPDKPAAADETTDPPPKDPCGPNPDAAP